MFELSIHKRKEHRPGPQHTVGKASYESEKKRKLSSKSL